MKKVRIAIIGTGFIGNYHARALQNTDGAEAVVACDLDKDLCQRFADKYSIPLTATKALSLARRVDIDAIIIGIPNRFHMPYALAMIEAGKDVLIEKPMAMSSAEGIKISKAAEKHKRVVMVGHMWRFDTEANFVHDVIQSGRMGKVIKTKGYGIHVNWGPGGWFTQKKEAGGGALVDMGVHPIDTVRYIMGDPLPVSVYASIGTHYGDYDVDDTGVIMINWDNGVTSIIESGWWQPHMDGPEASTRLYCKEGYASLFPTELKLKVDRFPGSFKAPMPERSEHCDQAMYDRQMEHFVECIRRRKTPKPGTAEGQIILKILDASYKSSRSGEAVKL